MAPRPHGPHRADDVQWETMAPLFGKALAVPDADHALHHVALSVSNV